MKLTPIALKQLEQHKTFKNLLAVEMGKSEATIRRWLKNNDPMLTTETSIRLIERETGLSRKKILSA